MPNTEENDRPVSGVLWEDGHERTGRRLRLVVTRARSGHPDLRLELVRPVGKALHIDLPGVFVDDLALALEVFRKHRRQFLRDRSSGR